MTTVHSRLHRVPGYVAAIVNFNESHYFIKLIHIKRKVASLSGHSNSEDD